MGIFKSHLRRMATFSLQSQLPRLPIPSLEETSRKTLQTLQPLLNEAEYYKAEQIMADFIKPNGIGRKLQSKLISYDKTQPYSWLENIWLNKAYLEYREPSMINVNWFMVIRDHPAHDGVKLGNQGHGVFNDWQLFRAASIIKYVLDYHYLIENEKIKVEMVNDRPLCMNQYKCLFGVTRIPGDKRDTIQYYPDSKHFIVLIEDQIYRIDVEDNYSISHFFYTLKNLVATHQRKYPSVCWLTAGNRDSWNLAYQKSYGENQSSFLDIASALFAMSLDEISPGNDLDMSAKMVFHRNDARNRWFDKSLSFNVFTNGRAGLNGEHSPCDAVVPGRILDFIVENEKVSDQTLGAVESFPITHLKFNVSKFVQESIEQSNTHALGMISNLDLTVLVFKMGGSNLIKSLKASPDGFVQMALQLAYYRMHKKFAATYESSSTRLFLHGRTECGRILSNESVHFCKVMTGDDEGSKVEAFVKALAGHRKYMTDASLGKGVDRHLLGLRVINEDEKNVPELFTDPLFSRGTHFELSTSSLSPGDSQLATGFGPVSESGYGVNYGIADSYIKFAITSRHSCPQTNSSLFKKNIEQSLLELIELMSKSKL